VLKFEVRCAASDMVSYIIYGVYLLEICFENGEVDETSSRSCPVTSFVATVVRSVALFTRESVSFLVNQ
jgi:hypothetical protein